ncbi:MAG: hypothetical protein OXN97_12800 [Bryobacterales bacterium]|nr:hypothetical protein [Bryobacterales bacterium]MDE0629417.1 hypothetical protein [Bryobacterales bacterium]
MPFFKSLIREAVRKAAQDPRVRDTAKRVFDDEIKPRAKDAWEKAKPEVEAAWERAKPEVQAAKDKAMKKAASLADRVNRGIQESAVKRREDTNEGKDTQREGGGSGGPS